ncbi:SRPBCC domain-containing protein [Mucilaginibacter sp. HMF5004]|uniref:SRPBCC family protein n=1 Tax=Mucilaginibacter rivuli TaxID=2857527 RepID=UPI001C5EC0E4|nr:SRPBCC domain-containing protein [Mucilaginibacter rivuli]MBW4891928.1 SRPBCC domain-containing protein [Mucilaginibacter rivuli]
MSTAPLVLERVYNAPIGKVWTAISDLEHMRKWYFKLDEFKAEVGFEFHFYGDGNKENLKYATSARVVAVEPGKKLAYTWSLDAAPAITTVTWELFEEGGNTRLVLTHEGLETIPGTDYPRDSFNGGWTSFMGKLDNYLSL